MEQALLHRGMSLVHGGVLDWHWAREAGRQVDAVHLHWLEYLFFSGGGRLRRWLSMHAQALRVVAALRTLRRSRVRVVWTVHNLRPHAPEYPLAHRIVRAAVVRSADALIVHSHYARARAASQLRYRGPIHVAPHGSYIGAYPTGVIAPARLRERLGLPADAFVYLIFGHVLRYKRVPEAIEAFARFDAADARLLVAGQVWDPAERERVERAAERDPRVVLALRELTDEEVAPTFALAGAAVFNYGEVFSSGALLLALSFGVPAIVPEAGAGAELAAPPATAPFAPGQLDAALRAVRDRPTERSSAALAAAHAQRWEDMAAVLETVYRGADTEPPCTGRRRPARGEES